MKRASLARLLRYATPVVLAAFLLLAACQKTPDVGTAPSTDTAAITLPDTLPVTELPTESDESGETPPPPVESPIQVTTFAASDLPDFQRYTSAGRIKEMLSKGKSFAYTVGSELHYAGGELVSGESIILTRAGDGSLQIKEPNALARSMGIGSASGNTLDEIASSIGMRYVVYDNKTILFYDSFEAPLDPYDDLYTFEAMTLYMQRADETELVNAFIDLPDRVSNGTSNTVFYTAPDLNLGVQTSVYYAQMGQLSNVATGPALVAGEGRHENNYTTVRIFNHQQTCTTQFLAFDPSVMGGVQVAAAAVGDETLIATAPFANHDGTDGDVRIFDTHGLLRMTVNVRDVIPGPHTILTGRFDASIEDELLLIASQTTDAQGELHYVLLSLSDGRILGTYSLDCSFAMSDQKAAVSVNLTTRTTDSETSLILHFPAVQAVYEGSAGKGEFEHANITLPSDAICVSASNLPGERYTVSLPAREGTENQSFLTVYGDTAEGVEQDVGFRENRFFAAYYTSGFNDDKYVSRGDFCHIRTDLTNNGMATVPAGNDAAIDAHFDSVTYDSFASWEAPGYAERLKTDYLFLEPCFSHRWNKVSFTAALAAYKDSATGMQTYVSVGRDGRYMDYNELGSAYYVGTYADGLLDLAKIRLYPLRSFLQTTASAFRGEDGNPEHLVGMSPVHEHEINVPGSIGDYNPAMLEGFARHMLNRYGSVENINKQFGTSFASESDIDAPRDQGRGDWDRYENGAPYLTEWAMYNRTIVSKRIIEAYREALLAGYPPESISAHQMPEGEAVAGFLGDAATRLTPVDVVLTCGTAYGGTRYGLFYSDSNNFVRFAKRLGHNSTTIGEYCARVTSGAMAYDQLRDLWERGVRMVHQLTLGDPNFTAAEADAIRRLEEVNSPRPGYTGGTYGTMDVRQGEDAYRIVQIGEGADSKSIGLLKSIDAEGKWEGTVYLVPFHTKMKAEAIDAIQAPMEGTTNCFSTGVLSTIKNSDQVEIMLEAFSSTAGATVTFEVYHKGTLLTDSITSYTLSDTRTPYRYVLSNQLYEDGLEVRVIFSHMDATTVDHVSATLQTEYADFFYYNKTAALRNCRPHVGGVTYDILDRDRKG